MDGRAPLLDLHLGRMRRSARLLGLPEGPSEAMLTIPAGDGILRLILETRGFRSESLPLPVGIDRERLRGIWLPTTWESWPDPAHKRIDRSIHARLEGLEGGETARLDREKRLWESTRSNLFAVRENTLETADPPGVLPGIARTAVLQAARTLGIRVIHRPPKLEQPIEDLEIFATNAVRGVRPVRALGRLQLSDPGSLTRELQRALDVRMALPALLKDARGAPDDRSGREA